MYIKWHGHSCFEIGNNLKIVVDPHDGGSIGLQPPKASPDYVFVTHEHFDHNAVNVLNGKFKVIRDLGEFHFPNLDVSVLPAFHDEMGGKKRGAMRLFKFTLHSVTFLHVGDLGHVPTEKTVSELKAVDFLFIPVGGVFTIDAKQASRIATLINPRVIVPMHYKTPSLSLGLNSVTEFLKIYPDSAIQNVGNMIDFESEDIPSSQKIWVFSL